MSLYLKLNIFYQNPLGFVLCHKLLEKLNKDRPIRCHLLYYFIIYCSTRFEYQYIHPQELATYLLSYFMGCIALVRCVLVLRCGLAGVVWHPYAG